MQRNDGTSTCDFIPAHLARNMDLTFLREVIVNISSAKNDLEGVGSRISIRVQPISSDRPFDIASTMFEFNKVARPEAEHPFLSWQGKWCYDVSHLNLAIKQTVVRARFHLNPKLFEFHSLRIAGATILAAAGVPDYIIQKYGRWKSDTYIRYIRLSVKQHQVAASAIFSLNSLSFGDLRRVMPGVNPTEGS